MKTGIRIMVCAILAAVAAVMAGYTIALFGETPPVQDSLYMLRQYGGRVAVYGREDPTAPITVTDIELSSLRQRDRELIEAGLPAQSREELARLLEDLGS